jgi:hypothetical protein
MAKTQPERRIDAKYTPSVRVATSSVPVGGLQPHDLDGSYHTASGLTIGEVVAADSSNTFSWRALLHDELGGVTANQHHNQVHGIVSSDHTGTGAQYSVVGFSATDTLGVLATTSDGAANHNTILRSDANGRLDLDTLVTPQILTSSGNLTIDAVGDVVFPQAQQVRSDNFTAGIPIQGWWIGQYNNGTADSTTRNAMQIYSITIDELRARTFVADEVRVDRGEEFVTKSYGIVNRPFTTPATLGGTVTAWFDDSAAINGAIFSSGDYLLFRIFDDSSDFTIANILFTVSSYADQTNDRQTWTLTLVEGLTNYEIKKGAVGWDWGQSGQGYIHSSVVDTSGAPYVDIRTWITGGGSGGPLEGDTTTHVRIGKLISALDSDMSPTGWGLFSDNAYLKGTVLAAGGIVRLDDNGVRVTLEDSVTAYNDLYAYVFHNEAAAEIGGLYTAYFTSPWAGVATSLQAHGDGTNAPLLSLFADSPTDTGNPANAQVLIQAINTARQAVIDMDATSSTTAITIDAATVTVNGTMITDAIRPDADNTRDFGTASFRWKDGYFAGTLNVEGGISGDTLDGAEWEYTGGNMTIDANNASDVTVAVVNQGAGRVDLDVDRNITLGGTIDGVDLASLAGNAVLSTRTLTAGAGLTGGGSLAADRTFDVGAGDGITVNANDVAVNSTVVRTTRTLTAGGGLTGGGDLSANRTFAVGAGTLITVNSDDVALSNGSAQYQIPVTGATPFAPSWTSLAVFAGDGLVFTTNNVFDVVAGNGLTVGTNAIALTQPGTLTVTSDNDNSGNHKHAITTSADPGSNAVILASTAAGGLTLQSLTVEGSVDITNGGDFTVGANVFFVDASGTRVGINCAPDPQFDLDVLGNIRTQSFFVGRHAMTVKDAILISHFDGAAPYETNEYGEPNGHMGQVATLSNTPIYRHGKFLKALEIADATTNLISNPSAETNLTGWTAFATGTGAGTVTRITTQSRFGVAAMRINKTAGADGDNYGAYHDFSVTNGQSYTLSAWVKAQTLTGGTQTVTISAGQALNAASASINGESDEWQRISVTTTAASTGSGRLSIYIDSATTGAIIVDGVQAENVAYATPYTDSIRSACNLKYTGISVDWDDFTAMLWVKPAALPSVATSRYLLDVYVDSTNRYIITADSTGDKIRATDLNGPTTLISTTSVQAETWIHVALVVDGTTATLYINGVAEDSDTFAAVAGTSDIYVGSENDNTDRINGLVDDLVIVRRALPASEIKAVYESDAPVFAETSVFHFRATPTGLVWADEEGLWMRDEAGVASFGISGVNGKSWGGQTLDKGDLLIGNNSGNYVRWNKSSGVMTFVGNGGGITAISGSNITTGTIDASVATITNINASNITTGTLNAARIAAGSITSSHIAANTITAADIAAGTITATEIAASTITGDKMNVTTLSAIQANTGALTITNTLTINTGVNAGFYQGTGTFGSPTTGLKIWRDGNIGRIGGFNGGTLQWYADTDGKMYAGGGNVLLDASGVTVAADTALPWAISGVGGVAITASKAYNFTSASVAGMACGITSAEAQTLMYSQTGGNGRVAHAIMDSRVVATSANDEDAKLTLLASRRITDLGVLKYTRIFMENTNSATISRITLDAANSSELEIVLDGEVTIGEHINPFLVDQSSTTAAIPVLTLDQADLSEEFINFVATIGAGNPINTTALGAYYGRVRVAVNGTMKWLALYD